MNKLTQYLFESFTCMYAHVLVALVTVIVVTPEGNYANGFVLYIFCSLIGGALGAAAKDFADKKP